MLTQERAKGYYRTRRGVGVATGPVLRGQGLSSSQRQRILPQANPADFFVQQYNVDQFHFVSVVRATTMHELVKTVANEGFDVIKVFQGPFVVASALPYMNAISGNISLPYETLEISGNRYIASYVVRSATERADFRIGEEIISNQLLLSYAAALTWFVGRDPQTDVIESAGISSLHDDWEQMFVFKKSFVLALIVIFVIVFINAIAFSFLYQENAALNERAAEMQYSFKELSELKEYIRKNEQFIRSAGWHKKTPVWYFADQVGLSLIDGVFLTELNIHPLSESDAKTEKKLLFSFDLIDVKGRCKSPREMNEWLAVLKKNTWVKEITSQQYHYSDREKTGMFSFTIVTNAK